MRILVDELPETREECLFKDICVADCLVESGIKCKQLRAFKAQMVKPLPQFGEDVVEVLPVELMDY